MGFWGDICDFAEWAMENPSDAFDHIIGKGSELVDILTEGGKEFGESASDAYNDLTPAIRGPYQLFFKDKVSPQRGSILCCHLGLAVDHSGIYIGENRIVHMSGDDGIEVVGPAEFLARLGGSNPALTIWCACRNDTPVASEKVARRAEKALGDLKWQDYDLWSKNCHQLTQYCITGKMDNGVVDFTFNNLLVTLRDTMDANSWRVADLV